MAKYSKAQTQTKQTQLAEQAMSQELIAVSKHLKEMKFSPKMFGVDEADVWRKMEKLRELYEIALDAERAKTKKAETQLRTIIERLRARNASGGTSFDG